MELSSWDITSAIKEARKNKGLTQRDLSKKTGIPQSHISKIEKGVVDVHISSLIEIARALGFEVMLVQVTLVSTVQALQKHKGRDQEAQIPKYQLGPEDGEGDK